MQKITEFDATREEPRIELIAITRGTGNYTFGPEELSAFGALACRSEEASLDLLLKHAAQPKEEFEARKESVLNSTIGSGHGSVSDQNHFIYCITNLPRAVTLLLCAPQYLAHLQQSLRFAKASRGYYLPPTVHASPLSRDARRVLDEAFSLYSTMMAQNIPGEDARYVLPLYTKTNIQTAGNARELTHLHAMSQREEVPSIATQVVEAMITEARKVAPRLFVNRGKNYETLGWLPASQLYASSNNVLKRLIAAHEQAHWRARVVKLVTLVLTDEDIATAVQQRDEAALANLKHVHNAGPLEAFLAPMSLASFHQATRQRTWDQSIESIYDAAHRGAMVVPPSIKDSQFAEAFEQQCKAMHALYNDLVAAGVQRKEAVGVLPHALMVYDLIHLNGWNVIHAIGQRTCTKAQWEIRSIANQIAAIVKERNPALGAWAEPLCVTYGYCPERKPCGYLETRYRQKTSAKEPSKGYGM